MSEEGYVYVIESISSDIPSVQRYTLIEKRPGGVRVWQRGFSSLIRNATGRAFFYSTAELRDFYVRHLEARISGKRSGLRQCEEALANGISFHVVPAGAPPPPRPGWLDPHLELHAALNKKEREKLGN